MCVCECERVCVHVMGLVPLLSSSPLLPTKPLLLFPVWDTLVCTDPSKDIEPVEQPASLSVKLLPFQREGVAWMIHQVRACVRACVRVCACTRVCRCLTATFICRQPMPRFCCRLSGGKVAIPGWHSRR